MKIVVSKICSFLGKDPVLLDFPSPPTAAARADRYVLFIMPLLLYVFFFCIPFAKVIAGPVYVTYCLLYGVHLCLRADRKYLQEPRMYYIILLLYLLMAAFSLTYTIDVANGLKSLKTQVGLIMIPVLIETVYSPGHARRYLYVYAFGGAILGSMIIYDGLVLHIDRPGALWHPVHGAHLLTFAAVISLALCISENNLNRKILSCCLLFFLSFALYINGTRGAWAALGAALFVAPFLMIRLTLYRRLLYVGIVLLSIVLILCTPYGQKKWNDTIDDFRMYQINKMGSGFGPRLELWKASSSMFLQNPILGIGIGGWGKEFHAMNDRMETSAFLRENNYYNQTHNIYFDVLSTRGIIGLVAFLAVLFYPLIYAWNKRDEHHVLYRNTVIFSGIVFMVAGFTDGLVDIRWSFLSYIALTGIGLALLVRNAAPEKTTKKSDAICAR